MFPACFNHWKHEEWKSRNRKESQVVLCEQQRTSQTIMFSLNFAGKENPKHCLDALLSKYHFIRAAKASKHHFILAKSLN